MEISTSSACDSLNKLILKAGSDWVNVLENKNKRFFSH